MNKTMSIYDLTYPKLESFVLEQAWERFRAEQIFNELYVKRSSNFDAMLLLPKEIRLGLSDKFSLDIFRNFKKRHSSDGSVKYLFELHDSRHIEAVYMPWESDDGSEIDRVTLCISSMAGCPVGCSFCATGTLGFKRNLTASEIVGQILAVEQDLGCKIDNIVFMGMGEPLLNYANVVDALNILTDERSKLLSRRRITLSTSGVAPRIKQLAEIEKPVKLAISLHATTNKVREKIMPITKSFPISKLMDSVEYYYRKTKMDVTYEYIIFEGVNDSQADANRLARFGKRVPSRINIIPFNDISFTNPSGLSSELKAVSKEKMIEFASIIRSNGVPVIIRDTFGADIEAACGQLALSEEKKELVIGLQI